MTCEPPEMWKGFCYIRDYHPYRRGRNPQFGREDGKLLDFKDGKAPAIDEVATIFEDVLGQIESTSKIALAMVPGHQAQRSNRGTRMARVIRQISSAHVDRYLAATDLLLRHRAIPKLASGGNRSIETHLDSITVADPDAVRNAIIVVLDDVTTTGNSLLACRILLKVYAPSRVGLLALGRTV